MGLSTSPRNSADAAHLGISDRTMHGMFALTIVALGLRTVVVALQVEDAHEPFLAGRIMLLVALASSWAFVWRVRPVLAIALATSCSVLFALVLAIRSGNLAGEPLTITVSAHAVIGLFGGRRWAVRAIAGSMTVGVAFVVLTQVGWITGRDFVAEASLASQASYAIAVSMTASFVALASSAAEELAQQVQRTNAELAATLASAPIGIATVNQQGIVIRSNRTLDTMLVGGNQTMVGLPLLGVAADGESPPMQVLLKRVFAGQAVEESTEMFFIDADGSLTDTRVRIGRVESGQRPRLVTATIEDVSQRRLLEREVEVMQRRKSLGTLAQGIAHDFNNLLAAVQAHVAVARTKSARGEAVDTNLDKIIEGTERAASLTTQLLDYAGGERLVASPVSINCLVTDVVGLFAPSMGEATIHLELSDDLPTITGDSGRLQQVVMNLLLNARNAIGAGDRDCTGAIMVRTSEVAVDADPYGPLAERRLAGRYVQIQVEDSGCGIASADLERVFDPFFTTDPAGHGLGLSVVLGIVQSHHGSLRVESELGDGSVFTVMLPVMK